MITRRIKQVLYTPFIFVGATLIWCVCKPFDRFGDMPGWWEMAAGTVTIVWCARGAPPPTLASPPASPPGAHRSSGTCGRGS